MLFSTRSTDKMTSFNLKRFFYWNIQIDESPRLFSSSVSQLKKKLLQWMPPRCDKRDLCISTEFEWKYKWHLFAALISVSISWFMVPLITVGNDNQTETQVFMKQTKKSWLICLLKTKDFFLFDNDNVCATHFPFSEAIKPLTIYD